MHHSAFTFVVLTVLPLLITAPSGAADYVVNNSGDAALAANVDDLCQTAQGNRQCTLRAAIQLTNSLTSADRIFFGIPTSDPNYNAQTGSWTVPLTAPLPDIASGNLIITGPGASKLTVSGRGAFRVLNVTTSGTVSISGITIADGQASSGAGIFNLQGTLNLANCVVTRNTAGTGSAGGNGGGIANAELGTITIRSSTVSFNRALFASPNQSPSDFDIYGRGGGLLNYGTATIIDSDFYHNQSGIRGGGIHNNSNALTVANSTFRENGTFVRGGGIENYTAVLSVSNSTFYANYAYGVGVYQGNSQGEPLGSGAAIYTIDDGAGSASQISNSTFTANFATGSGGAVYGFGIAPVVKSTLIAGNFAGASSGGQDVFGAFTSQGFNFIGKSNGSTGFTAATDKKGTIASPLNPKFDLKGLRNNGGPTLTVALMATSPAVDKGTSLGLTGILSTDQRGAGFLRKVDKSVANASGGDGTDIGAFELQ